jgi:hypothetical protein
MDKSQACRWVHALLPILELAFDYALVLPARKISSFDEFLKAFSGVSDVFVDGTERQIQKSKNHKRRNKSYSGKKK